MAQKQAGLCVFFLQIPQILRPGWSTPAARFSPPTARGSGLGWSRNVGHRHSCLCGGSQAVQENCERLSSNVFVHSFFCFFVKSLKNKRDQITAGPRKPGVHPSSTESPGCEMRSALLESVLMLSLFIADATEDG